MKDLGEADVILNIKLHKGENGITLSQLHYDEVQPLRGGPIFTDSWISGGFGEERGEHEEHEGGIGDTNTHHTHDRNQFPSLHRITNIIESPRERPYR